LASGAATPPPQAGSHRAGNWVHMNLGRKTQLVEGTVERERK